MHLRPFYPMHHLTFRDGVLEVTEVANLEDHVGEEVYIPGEDGPWKVTRFIGVNKHGSPMFEVGLPGILGGETRATRQYSGHNLYSDFRAGKRLVEPDADLSGQVRVPSQDAILLGPGEAATVGDESGVSAPSSPGNITNITVPNPDYQPASPAVQDEPSRATAYSPAGDVAPGNAETGDDLAAPASPAPEAVNQFGYPVEPEAPVVPRAVVAEQRADARASAAEQERAGVPDAVGEADTPAAVSPPADADRDTADVPADRGEDNRPT